LLVNGAINVLIYYVILLVDMDLVIIECL
jgi:hypothetical protein